MLKIWKKTWKEHEEASRKINENQASDPNRSMVGPSSGSSSDVVAAVPSSQFDSPVPAPLRSKRSRTDLSPEIDEETVSERPIKVPKVDHLRDHLPEILEPVDDEHMAPLSMALFTDQVVEQAKRENTIAVIPPRESSIDILLQFLDWAIKTERSSSQNRTNILVVNDELSDKYISKIASGIPGTMIEKYTEPAHSSKDNSWSNVLQKDVVIISSSLLRESFTKGLVNMSHLHSLIINDANTIIAQDSHPSMPIVQIMNNFYRSASGNARPRILALVGSVAGRWSHFDSKMLKFELILDAKVFGVTSTKRDEILALPDAPNEVIVLYEGSGDTEETRLLTHLKQWDSSETIFPRHFRTSRHVHAELGSCASDLVWRRALKDIEKGLDPWHVIDEDEENLNNSTYTAKYKIKNIIKNWAFTMPNLDENSRGFNVTRKFLKLVRILESCEPYGEGFRGIIFVQRRIVALVMADLLRTLGGRLNFLRPCAIVGHHASTDLNYHEEIFRRFTGGTYNLLIATKSVEDLDLPKASMVICYDFFESHVSHAYVRACTRGRESHLVYLAERGNDFDRKILSKNTHLDAGMQRWTETLCRSPESSIPPHTLRETTHSYHSDSEDDECEDYIKDPVTSGRIYVQDATNVVYRFAANPNAKKIEKNTVNGPLFAFEDIDVEFGRSRAFVCKIILPQTPIDGVSGSTSMSIAHARRSACYKACQELSRLGLLSYHLFPMPPSLLAQNYGERKETTIITDPPKLPGTNCYPLKHPDFWVNCVSYPMRSLYPMVIYSPHATEDEVQPRAPILLLTRQPLPELPEIKLFISGVPLQICFQKGSAFEIDGARLEEIYKYTLRICRAILNKAFECPMEEAPYFFAPLPPDWKPSVHEFGGEYQNLMQHVKWDQVARASLGWIVPIIRDTPSAMAADLEDSIIQDRAVEFTRRYEVVRVRTDMTPMSKPTDSLREAAYDSLLEFCKAMRKGFEGLADNQQPIIEVRKVPDVVNNLNPIPVPMTPGKPPAKYLIPELCNKFVLPASTMRMGILLPSIMKRIDDLLLVKEMNSKFFDHVLREDLLHIAVSAPSANIEYDYERLELLGDAFLKYLSSIYVFVTNPTYSEGSLHMARQKYISNKVLLENSRRIGLPAYIQSRTFTARNWHPANFRLAPPTQSRQNKPSDEGNTAADEENVELESLQPILEPTIHISQSISEQTNPPTNTPESAPTEPSKNERTKRPRRKRQQKGDGHATTQWLGDKAIADVAEAIIGAAYITGGRAVALQVTKALNIPISNIDSWSDFGRKVLTPPPTITAKLGPGSIEGVEHIIGHKFKRPHLLAQALTHSSIKGYQTTSYERLEFVGDAILDFMVIRYIFDREKHLAPGGLTLLKGAMVSNSALAAVCVWSKLHQHLLLESYAIRNSIQDYIGELKISQFKEYEAAEEEGRPPGQYWDDIEPPKALSDVVESIIGAVYISDAFSPTGAESFFDKVLKPFYDKHITLSSLTHHPTKILFELFQEKNCQHFEICKEKIEDATRCSVLVHNVILASAEDPSPTYAARRASMFALDALQGDSGFMARTCDCQKPVKQWKAKGSEHTDIKNETEHKKEKEDDMKAVD